MVKNNLKSLLIHIIISLFSIMIFFIIFLPTPKWASGEAAIRHHNRMMLISIMMIGISLILYFLSARKYLIKQENIIKNLMSAIIVAIIGAFMWVVVFNVDFEVIRNSYSLLYSDLWQSYCAFNGYSLSFLDEYQSKNYLLFLLFSFMPSIAMTLGVLSKNVLKQSTT